MAPYILNLYKIHGSIFSTSKVYGPLHIEDAVTNVETTIDIHDRHAGAVMIECFYWIHPLL